MKTFISSFAILLLLSFSGCITNDEGPVGPVGPRGPEGPEGPQGAPGESGYVFEWENIDFTAGNNYEVLLEYPSDFEVFDSDVALAYLLWPTEEDPADDIWRALPQTVLHPEGLLQYNYDFTKFDVKLFLDANFSLDMLGAVDTDGWIVRVVVVPGEFWNTSGRVDFSNYSEVSSALGIPALEVRNSTETRR